MIKAPALKARVTERVCSIANIALIEIMPCVRSMTREVKRAFSADAFGLNAPGALPQAAGECCAVGAKTYH